MDDFSPPLGRTRPVRSSHANQQAPPDIGSGQTRLTCPAGTVVLLHHGIWHSGRRNDTAHRRSLYKLRLNPTVPQVRLWDACDLHEPAVTAELGTYFPWYEQATARLEIYNRVLLWRALTGDESFDVEYWVTRVSNRLTLRKPA